MGDPRPPRDGMGHLADELKRIRGRLEALESPSGTQRGQVAGTLESTVNYLYGLRSYGVALGINSSLTNQPADNTVRWFGLSGNPALTHTLTNIEIPTGRVLMEASIGEASITPPGGTYGIAYVTVRVKDADDKVVSYSTNLAGRLYSDRRMGAGISTGAQALTIDPEQFRGPFSFQPLVGIWGASGGSTSVVSCTFTNPSMRVEIIGADSN